MVNITLSEKEDLIEVYDSILSKKNSDWNFFKKIFKSLYGLVVKNSD